MLYVDSPVFSGLFRQSLIVSMEVLYVNSPVFSGPFRQSFIVSSDSLLGIVSVSYIIDTFIIGND